MQTLFYILISILSFGFLIMIHEGGHYLFARLFNVTVKEFSIGMGPTIISKKSKKSGIVYSWRAFPIGGFVSMAGEDEETDDPNGFNKKPVWQRIIIAVAGAATNLIAGFLVMSILVFNSEAIGSTTVAAFMENSSSQKCGLRVGDKIVKVENERVHIGDELLYEIMRYGIEPTDITVIRNGKTLTIEDVEFPQISEQGVAFGMYDFQIYALEKTPSNLIKTSFWRCSYTVRMIYESLYDLVSGRYGIEAVSGPVGVTEALTDAAKESSFSFISLVVIISINLGVMNLLPLPALDGGRILLLIIESIRRKPIPKNVEGYINGGGLAILLLLMFFICIKDIAGLIF